MKAQVKYSLSSYVQVIDLEYYGHDEDKKWEDLTEEEQNEIQDHLREEQIVMVSVEGLEKR